mmetsp:Transcript_3254/g.9262  ORF Transcript_3254/g.9262 Transcript_3254/m.9262 type:complete len:117 (+) Transcript_3254:212-562(+)
MPTDGMTDGNAYNGQTAELTMRSDCRLSSDRRPPPNHPVVCHSTRGRVLPRGVAAGACTVVSASVQLSVALVLTRPIVLFATANIVPAMLFLRDARPFVASLRPGPHSSSLADHGP